MRVAVVQMEIVQGDIDANLAKMVRFIKSAKRKRADVVVFPEYCLTGSVKGRPDLIDRSGDYRKVFSFLAASGRIDIVSGSFVEEISGKPYNTSCYFDRSGKMLGRYRKMNLWHSERGRLSRGAATAVFDTRFGRAGIAICWDLTSSGLFRSLARKGARVVYVPSFWSDAGISNAPVESRNIDNLCFVRAFENELIVVYANAAGSYLPGDDLIGHSQMTAPIIGAVRRMAHNRESMFVARAPEKTLARAAKVYKIREDMLSGYIR
ncbi:MAG: carbon-nitrogen hydrolase family protein [Candidatus Micrarchaeia archaeon]